jgi:peptidoglycan/LPS O-acetylase OafA/YrhL
VADSIATGCVLAVARPWLHDMAAYGRLLDSPFFVAVPVVGLLANLTHDHPIVHFAVGMTVANLAIALCIDWAVTHHEGRIGRVLKAAPLVFVGWISYSLYLWQQPFLNRASDAAVAAFPLNIIIAVSLALVSYFIVERPALRMRKQIERALFGQKDGDREPIRVPIGAPVPPAAT